VVIKVNGRDRLLLIELLINVTDDKHTVLYVSGLLWQASFEVAPGEMIRVPTALYKPEAFIPCLEREEQMVWNELHLSTSETELIFQNLF
jgi:hypothetical protein